jgi:hypothetical protein
LSEERVCHKVRNLKTTRHRYAWSDETQNGFRRLYIRCVGCRGIFELVDKPNADGLKFSIDDETNRVWPCIVCPYCSCHVYTTLKRYRRTDAPDIFRALHPGLRGKGKR